MKVDLEDVAPVQIGTLFQLDGNGLDKPHEDDDGKAEVAGHLRENDRNETEPAVARTGDAHNSLHAENQNNGGEDGKHHPAEDDAV